MKDKNHVVKTLAPVILKKPKQFNIWYLKGININYSFDTLNKLTTLLGGNLMSGDYLIADNRKGDKRKVFVMRDNTAIILYAKLTLKNDKFIRHTEKDGKITNDNPRPPVDYLLY